MKQQYDICCSAVVVDDCAAVFCLCGACFEDALGQCCV
jgi:hypothetical protein